MKEVGKVGHFASIVTKQRVMNDCLCSAPCLLFIQPRPPRQRSGPPHAHDVSPYINLMRFRQSQISQAIQESVMVTVNTNHHRQFLKTGKINKLPDIHSRELRTGTSQHLYLDAYRRHIICRITLSSFVRMLKWWHIQAGKC